MNRTKRSTVIGIIILVSLALLGLGTKMLNFANHNFSKEKQSDIVIGMALLDEVPKVNFKKIVDEMKHKYGLAITGDDFDDQLGIGVFQLKGAQIGIILMDKPIPGDELSFPSKISYFWPEAKDRTQNHKAHIIISVSALNESKLAMYKTFTKVAAAVLTTTNSLGIYLGNQTLVLPADFYVAGANEMTENDLPLTNWIYFGLRDENGKSSGYTFGLDEFGFHEFEILNSNHSKEEILEMLFNLSHYVILGNVTLKDGETIGLTEQQRLKLTKSKGVQLDRITLKVAY